MKNKHLGRIAVALDTSERSEFNDWCRLFGPRVGVLKVGLEAFARWGPSALEEARKQGAEVFADLKLHDIPNTVGRAVGALQERGVDYLTIHSAGGPKMLEAAAQAARGVKLLAVTVLTHVDEPALTALDLPGTASDRALGWARLAVKAGCSGAVCSPREVARLRHELPNGFLLVTPGIRTHPLGRGDDQRRTASAQDALAWGADLLVVGRPLTRAADPQRALDELAVSISGC